MKMIQLREVEVQTAALGGREQGEETQQTQPLDFGLNKWIDDGSKN